MNHTIVDGFLVANVFRLLRRRSMHLHALTALGAIENGYKVKLNTSAIGTIFTDKRDKYYAKLKEKGAQI